MNDQEKPGEATQKAEAPPSAVAEQPIEPSPEPAFPQEVKPKVKIQCAEDDTKNPIPLSVHLVGGDDINPFEQQTLALSNENLEVSKRTYRVAKFGFFAAAVGALFVYLQFREMSLQTQMLSSQSIGAAAGAIISETNTKKQLTIAQQQAKAAEESVTAITKQMRQDQRAWVDIEFANFKMVENKPLTVTGILANTGKTPAKQVIGQVVIEKVPIDGSPVFIYKAHPRAVPSVGIFVPNHPSKLYFQSLRFKPGTKHTDRDMEPLPMSESDIREINEGSSYVAAHGIINYQDIFGTPHWIKFCTYTSPRMDIVKRFVSACASYGDADNN